MRIDPDVYNSLDAETRAFVDRELAAYERLVERNPLQAFKPHSEAQERFLRAVTAIIAAFAGNRFGKTTSLVVKGVAQAVPSAFLPSHMRAYKRFEAPTYGWIVVPTTDKLYDTMLPALQKWVPKDALVGKRWDKSWSKERRQLNFGCGSTIAFKTYEQDPSTLGGAALHWVGYDEPPPKATREECMTRLVDFGGFEMFAMTPLKTNTGWIRREIWRKRESPDITVVKGSMHDNPLLDGAAKNRLLGTLNDLWRRAREFGDFVDVGGLIYPDFERCVQAAAWDPAFIRSLDVVVGVDPGMRNCGLVWVGFDSENVAYVFDELLLQDKTARDYAAAIRANNARWGIQNYATVVDPAAKQRAQANGMTVLSELNKEGVYPNLGQNDHELGFGQMRTRMQHGRLLISPDCRGLRDEADDYAAREPEEGKDDSHLEPIKGNDHRLDALRYAVLERFWDAQAEADAPNRNLGFQLGHGVVAGDLRAPERDVHPMGLMA